MEEEKNQTSNPQPDQTQQAAGGLKIDADRVSLLTIGMAGSGKTTFVRSLVQYLLFSQQDPAYVLNLDPAVQFLPYTPNGDIRQTIDYKKLMKEHQLGPNGAIMTALNLFCAQIDDTINNIEATSHTSKHVVVDTPGQIEVFTWSASGSIITQTLLTSMPTVLLYVLDLARCQNPNSFMSNMMFCCSIFYKMKLPMIIVLNKEDAADKEKVLGWIRDYQKLLEEFQNHDSYLSTFSKSMVLSLDEFYNQLRVVAVSSLKMTGFDQLKEAIASAKQEFMDVQYKDLVKNYNRRMAEEQEKQQKELKKFMKDYKKTEEQNKKKKPEASFNVQVSHVGPTTSKKDKEEQEIKKAEEKIQKMNIE
ncbi:hypothetical protein ABPG74_010554 [Tetrahymena malaccensis]